MREFAAIPAAERRRILRAAFVSSLPVLMGYVTMGFAAGVLMAVKGGLVHPAAWSALLAASTVSGTLSFAIVPLVADGASLAAVAALTLGINFRYAFYGFSMLGRWRGIPLFQKWFLVHSLADEIYALDLACHETDPLRHRLYCLWNHALNVSYWIVGTTAGALAGAALPIPSKGIEFAMAALFIVILTDQITDFAAGARERNSNGK